ncbi:MAG: hypothetical protein RLZZ179_1417 [Verrucomicrobiota bacterium]
MKWQLEVDFKGAAGVSAVWKPGGGPVCLEGVDGLDLRSFKVPPIVSKCTTCGHFRVHNFGGGAFN